MDLSGYVGLPWRDGGRNLDGLDCYGLLALVYHSELCLDLPSYTYPTAEDSRAIASLIDGELSPWHEIPSGAETYLDAVLMLEAGLARHIGLVASPGYVLHMRPGFDSVIETYRGGKLRRRIAGFFRHEDRL